MNKQAKFSFNKGMHQDISKSKHPGDFYYEGNAIRIMNTDSQSLYSVENEKGNKLEVIIPSPVIDITSNTIVYGGKSVPFVNSVDNEILNGELPMVSQLQVIIGHAVARNSIILFTTDDNGFDCIWEVNELIEGSFDLVLLYCRNLNFSTNNPIQSIFNFENELITKVYWADGANQLRFLNTNHSTDNGDLENLIDLNSNSINIVGNYELSQASLVNTSGGGVHTSGVIQYSYNLYKLNGAQTTISPLSEQVSLDRGLAAGGGTLNEAVGTVPLMNIETLDDTYSHIRVYSIKYTSINELPSISLIVDDEIDTYSNYRFTDDGNAISTLTIDEFIFLGSNPIIPRHIESKDNRLFAANYRDSAYVLDIDTRAYSHDSDGITKLYTGNIIYNNGVLTGANQTFSSSTPIVDYNYLSVDDAINPDYDEYRYQKNGTVLGGEGLYFSYELLQRSETQLSGNLKYLKFFKDNEIYRIGIQFYNRLGQTTEVKWVADFKTGTGNLSGQYNILKFNIKSTEFTAYINSLNLPLEQQPVGYKVLRAERNIADRTILCQGSLTGMMVQTTLNADNFDFWESETKRRDQSLQEVKLPIPISRGFVNLPDETDVNFTKNLTRMNVSPNGFIEGNAEIYSDGEDDYEFQQPWQYTKMMQLHSPDILFDTGLRFSRGLQLRIKGMANHNSTNIWQQRVNTVTNEPASSNRYENVTNLRPPLTSYGVIGPTFDGCRENRSQHISYNRQYTSSFSPASYAVTPPRNIYGTPEITERGQGTTSYNGDSEFRYANTLVPVISDGKSGVSRDDEAIASVNSFGERCITLVEGLDTTEELDRRALEQLIPIDISTKNGLLIAEISRPDSYIYSGGLYGGVSIEDKSRTSYIEVGTYLPITTTTTTIESPGDTFVQTYNFGRILKTDTERTECRVAQLSETVEHRVETTINLLNRSDLSLFGWDNKFQPRYDEYHDYNRVYSQDANLISRQTDNFRLKPVNNFDNRVISSRLKIPGETIDNWTDFLENDTMDLDGKYGAINALVNTRDEIYTLQDTAVSKLSINPRVQTQGSDGIGIELGRGAILYDYNYLTTQSGTLNKWSVSSSPTSFYYLDLLNKSFMRVNATSGVANLSDQYGMHANLQNNLLVSKITPDNPVLGKGAVGAYDTVNGDSYLTVLQADKSFTLRFNEKNNAFHSFEPYYPSRYINKGDILLTTSPDNHKLYTHFEGNYNEFYGEYHPSTITLMINPEADVDCVFNNIEYKSEAYIDDVDQPLSTLTHMEAWNEYQNTGRVELVLGRNSNLRRKFRKWSAIIARNQGGRDRMRNPWLFLKLELNKNDNTKFILHDIIINYTTY